MKINNYLKFLIILCEYFEVLYNIIEGALYYIH